MKNERIAHLLISAILLGVVVCAGAVGAFSLYKFTHPNPQSKLKVLLDTTTTYNDLPVVFQLGDMHFATPSSSLVSAKSTFQVFQEFFAIRPYVIYDEGKVREWLGSINTLVSKPASPAAVVFTNKAAQPFSIFPGSYGHEVAIDSNTKTVIAQKSPPTTPLQLELTITGTELSPIEVESAQKRVKNLLTKTLPITVEDQVFTLSFKDLVPFLKLPVGYNEHTIITYIEKLNTTISSPPVNPELIIEGKTVKKFTPPRDGRSIADTEALQKMVSALSSLETGSASAKVAFTVVFAPPKKTLASTNTLGIAERIGIGKSQYAHSIPNRIHNVSLTTEKIHTKLILPNEEFSFNAYLGEVSAKTGFKPAYVIKEGQTVLGDGGGVCQVSSTLFRAILDAGLPVTERRGHSYRVSYYEQNSKPGFDATVYSPHPDLRFKNDTSHAILINAIADPKTTSMYIELWGTSDGRKAEILNYKQWDSSPAPPPVYQDDPTLAPGKLKQIDFPAPGLKTSFDYVVSFPNGETRTQTFKTTYIPWRAVYLRGI